MAKTIIIDRDLHEDEKGLISENDQLILLKDRTAEGQHHNKNDILQWIESTVHQSINDKEFQSLFKVFGKSYWYHIRFRIFNKMTEHAQHLDKLPDLSILNEADVVFCSESKFEFWDLWTDDCRVISKSEKKIVRRDKHELFRRLKFAFSKLKESSELLKQDIDSCFYSPMQNSKIDSGAVIDSQLEHVMGSLGHTLKIEYQILPRLLSGDWMKNFKLPRKSPTIFSDSLLLLYLIKHPFTFLKLFAGYRQTKRLKKTLSLSYDFKFNGDKWEVLFSKYARKSRFAILQMYLFDQCFTWLFRKTNPELVLATGENNGVGRTFIEAARKQDITSFGIQHGILAPQNIDYRFHSDESKDKYPDYFLAWGEHSKNFVIKYGNQHPDKILVVGQPEFDRFFERLNASEDINQFRKQQNRSLIFFASQPQPNNESRIECAKLLSAFCVKHNLSCVVKLHPNESDDKLYEDVFTDQKISNRLKITDENIYPVMEACDYVSTCYSTVAWEGMSLKKPTIIFDPLKLDISGFSKYDFLLYVTDLTTDFENWKQDITTHVQNAFEHAELEFGPRDGQTAKRIVQALRDKSNLSQ